MKIVYLLGIPLLGACALVACSSDSDDSSGGSGASAQAGASGSSGAAFGGKGGTSGLSAAGTTAAGASSSGAPSAGASDGGANSAAGEDGVAGAAAGSGGNGLAGAAGDNGSAGEGGGAGEGGAAAVADCSVERAQLLGAVDTVATGDITVVSSSAGVTTLYIDATAGGTTQAASNPWIFVSLANSAKVLVSDPESINSSAWDLAIKRPVLYTNDGDGGPGQGGAVLIGKDFDAVTSADATGAAFATEKFLDATCAPSLDPAGAVLTSMSTWYDYDPNTHVLSPAAGTWLVRGAGGSLYKLKIQTYYGTPEGGTGVAGGAYLIQVGAL